MTIEEAIATLEAYLSGGDELGDVSHDDACEALNMVRDTIEFMADVNQEANKCLEAVKAERDALKAEKEADEKRREEMSLIVRRYINEQKPITTTRR